jgi:hypothetical protein
MAMANVKNLDIAGHRDDELLCRFLDGEASPEECLAVTERVRHDPGFAKRLEGFKANDLLLQSLNTTRDLAISPDLIARLTEKTPARAQTTAFPLTSRRSWFALAASVTAVVGLGLALQLAKIDNDPMPRMSAALAQALETNPSRSNGWDVLSDGRVLTFPAADGNWCREFMLASNESHWRGVACRENNTWVTQVIGSEVFLDHASGYRPAGADDNDTVARFIDEQASDVALSRRQEQALLENSWSK